MRKIRTREGTIDIKEEKREVIATGYNCSNLYNREGYIVRAPSQKEHWNCLSTVNDDDDDLFLCQPIRSQNFQIQKESMFFNGSRNCEKSKGLVPNYF